LSFCTSLRGERAGIGLHHVGEHLVLALGLVDGHLHLAFDLPDLLDDAGPLIEQRYDAAIHDVDARAAIAQPGPGFLFGHALATWKPCLSSRTKDSSWISSDWLPAFCSITRMIADPTTTASA
jgi:hypothetical protein